MSDVEFKILIRKPIYPIIVVSANQLYTAFGIKELARNCVQAVSLDKNSHVKVIDSKGEEFWYNSDNYVLAPGFSFKKWTKKSVIELFNSNLSNEEKEFEYSLKSISSKRLDRVIGDLCTRIKELYDKRN